MKKIREILVIIMMIIIPILGVIGIAWTIVKELAIIEILRNVIGG